MDVETAKRAAGERAAALVEDGMTVGLGTGSTARWFIDAVGRLVASGMRLRGVPTSLASAEQARRLGIPVVELGPEGVDLAVDGADRVDPGLDLVKGFGGALVREKIVAFAARRFVVVVDVSKLCPDLSGRLPVEVAPFGHRATMAQVSAAAGGAEAVVRTGPAGTPFITDNGGLIVDVLADPLPDAAALAAALDVIPGVLGHGLFLGMAERVLAAQPDGEVGEVVAPRRRR